MPPPSQQPPPSDTQQDQQLAAEAAVILGTAITAAAALAALAALFSAAGIVRAALGGSLSVVYAMPPERLGAHGPATLNTARLNLMRRAQFVVASGRRLTADLAAARSRNESLTQALLDGVSRERRYYGQHIEAIWNRMQAAARVDAAADAYGLLLGWYTTLDSRTSAECRAADGKNFYADQRPLIGYPGSVHPHCRCFPGMPHAGARLLAGSGAGRSQNRQPLGRRPLQGAVLRPESPLVSASSGSG